MDEWPPHIIIVHVLQADDLPATKLTAAI